MTTTDTLLSVVDYWTWPDRFSLVNEWWQAHGLQGTFQEGALPQLALIVCEDGIPVAFMAADMSNSIGKATIESALTAPGRSPAESRRALQFAERAIFSVLKDNQYGLCTTFTSKAIARTLVQNGWKMVGECVHLMKIIQ